MQDPQGNRSYLLSSVTTDHVSSTPTPTFTSFALLWQHVPSEPRDSQVFFYQLQFYHYCSQYFLLECSKGQELSLLPALLHNPDYSEQAPPFPSSISLKVFMPCQSVGFPISQLHYFLTEAEENSNPDKGITKMQRVYLPCKHLLFYKSSWKALAFCLTSACARLQQRPLRSPPNYSLTFTACCSHVLDRTPEHMGLRNKLQQ